MALAPLHCFAAREAEGRIREHGDGGRVSHRGELGERAGEQVVAGRTRGARAMRRPGGRAAASEPGAVDQIVVHQRRKVHELHRDAGHDGRIRPARAGEVDEERPQPLAAGGEGFPADFGDDSVIPPDGGLEPILELGEVRVQAGRLAELRESAHVASAVCRTTIPPAKVRWRTESKPAAAISLDSSSGPGKRRTLAGR